MRNLTNMHYATSLTKGLPINPQLTALPFVRISQSDPIGLRSDKVL